MGVVFQINKICCARLQRYKNNRRWQFKLEMKDKHIDDFECKYINPIGSIECNLLNFHSALAIH